MKKYILLFATVAISASSAFAQLGAGLPDRFTRKDSLRGTLSNIRNNYDVKFYNLDIKIDIEKNSLEQSFIAILKDP